MTTGGKCNALHYGDNLHVLRESIASESVDLVYPDPPFNSNTSYNVLFRPPSRESSFAKTLLCSPAMVARLSQTLWGMEGVLALIDAKAETPKHRYSNRSHSLKTVEI